MKATIVTFGSRIFIVLLFLLLKGLQSTGQEKSTLTGRVMRGKEPLAGASIVVTRIGESSMVGTATSAPSGKFQIQGLPLNDTLLISVSYSGYNNFRGLLFLIDKEFSMQTVQLKPAFIELDSVVVKAEKPVIIKGDTIEFRTSAIKTPPNSMAMDLLMRIPGLAIDRNGKLTFNGKPVSKILVDGRVFFGEDGIIALGNIAGDMIDRIQVAGDSNSNQLNNERLKDQVLNLKLKPGNKYFGNAAFLAGTDRRYDGKAFGSLIREKDRISVYAGRNNINKTGSGSTSFTIVSNGLGITENTFAGIDFGLKINRLKEIVGSYEINNPHTIRELIKERKENILSGTLLITQSLAEGENRSSNQIVSLKLLRLLNVSRPIFSSTLGWNNLESNFRNTASTKGPNGNLLNSLENIYQSKGSHINWTNEIGYSREIQNWNLNGNVLFTQTKQDLTDYNEGITMFYKNNAVDSQYRFRQHIETANQTEKLRVNFEVTKKMANHFSLALYNTFGVQFGSANRITRNVDTSGVVGKIDTNYSNQFRMRNLNFTNTFSFIYERSGWYVKPGLALLQNYQVQKDLTRIISIHNSHLNLVPRFDLSKLVDQRTFSLNYWANIILPTLEQLQPVQDIANPLHIYKGNAELTRSLEHNITWSYYNQEFVTTKARKETPLINNVSLEFNTVQHKIIPFIKYDSFGRQTSSFENVNGVYKLSGNFNTIYYFKRGQNPIIVELRPEISYLRDKIYLDGILNHSDNFSIQTQFSFTYQYADVILLSFDYAPLWSRLKYQQNRTLDQSYLIHNISVYLNLYLKQRIKLKQAVLFNYNNQLPTGFDKKSLLWNIEGSYLFLTNKKAEVSFSAFDLLKRFNNLTRTIAGNFIEDSQANNLQQYFILGFKYHFGAINKQR